MANDANRKSWLEASTPLLPLLTVGAAYFLYDLFKTQILNIERRTPMAGIALPSVLPDDVQGEAFVALLAWGVSALIYTIAWIGAVVVLLVQMWDSIRNEIRDAATTKHPRAFMLVVVALGAGAIVLGVTLGLRNPMTVAGMRPLLTAAFRALAIPDGELWLHVFNGFGIAIAFLLIVSAGVALWVTNRNASRQSNKLPSVEELRMQIDGVHRGLYAGAVVLVASVMQARAMHLLPTALVAGEAEETIKAVTQGYIAAQGTLWTIALVAFYVPTVAVLSRRAGEVARNSVGDPKVAGSSSKKWLEENGLVPSLGKRLVTLGAALAPFLTGGTIIDLLKMVA